MTNPEKGICCPGCLRTGVTNDRRRYCTECREDLKQQACVLCSTPVVTDVPFVLCDECDKDCRIDHGPRNPAAV